MLYHCKGLILEGNDRSEDDRISSSLSATATELTPSKFLPAAAVWSALGTLTAPASSAPRAESVGLPTPLELLAFDASPKISSFSLRRSLNGLALVVANFELIKFDDMIQIFEDI